MELPCYITGSNESEKNQNLKDIYLGFLNIQLKCQKVGQVFKQDISLLLVPFQSGTESPLTLSVRLFPPKAHCVKSAKFVQS